MSETIKMPAAEESKAEAAKSSTYVHKFAQPFEYAGKKYEEMAFYFDNLTGADMDAIENEMAMQSKVAYAPEVSTTYQAMLAARAAGVGADAIMALPLKDYRAITMQARNFLLG